MIAIFRKPDKSLLGYKTDVTQEEVETFQLDYLLADTLPEGLKIIPTGHYAIVDDDLTIGYQPFESQPQSELDVIGIQLVQLDLRLLMGGL